MEDQGKWAAPEMQPVPPEAHEYPHTRMSHELPGLNLRRKRACLLRVKSLIMISATRDVHGK